MAALLKMSGTTTSGYRSAKYTAPSRSRLLSGSLPSATPIYQNLAVGTRRAHVYLSDGGHFENLGIYELVRRPCSVIIA